MRAEQFGEVKSHWEPSKYDPTKRTRHVDEWSYRLVPVPQDGE